MSIIARIMPALSKARRTAYIHKILSGGGGGIRPRKPD